MGNCAKFLYTHNPFYLLSVGLVLFGLQAAFSQSQVQSAWWLAGSLLAYTILLALTAILIVRLGKVWDDARTIALLVVLLFVAISSSFDTLCIQNHKDAAKLLSTGFLLSVVVSEGILRGVSIPLPLVFRGPYYLLLALFFFFPIAVESEPWTTWIASSPHRVLSFSFIAGILFLTLIPAIHHKKWHDASHPWSWPLYPWSIFAFLVLGIGGRAYFLTLSFQADSGMDSTFGPYYLVPVAIALCIIGVEHFAKDNNKTALNALLFCPMIWIAMSCWHHSGQSYARFLADLTSKFGSPLWITLHVSLFYMGYLWKRGADEAPWGMGFMLLWISTTPPRTQFPELHAPLSVWPLMVIAAYQFWSIKKKGTTARFLIGSACILMGSTIVFQKTNWMSFHGAFPIHAMVVLVCLSSLLFRDRLALFLRKLLSPVTALWSFAIAIYAISDSSKQWLAFPYLLGLAMLVGVLWMFFRLKLWRWSFLLCLTAMGLLATSNASILIPSSLPTQAKLSLLFGAGFFAIGAIISSLKGGLLNQTREFLYREWRDVAEEWNRDTQ